MIIIDCRILCFRNSVKMATCTASLIGNIRKCDLISNLPDHIFSDIMVMLGRENLEDLQKCRQVCKIWNVMISQMTKLKKDTIRKEANSLTAKIRDTKMLHLFVTSPKSLCMIVTAASLAHHGMLGSVQSMRLSDVDLSSVPAEHLASLASCVTWTVDIYNVSNCDLVSILDSVKCEWLFISSQSLSSEETRALVRAMESGVEEVELGYRGDVSLDITALTQYRGKGECWSVRCYNNIAGIRYRVKVRMWARRIRWRALDVFNDHIYITRPFVRSGGEGS